MNKLLPALLIFFLLAFSVSALENEDVWAYYSFDTNYDDEKRSNDFTNNGASITGTDCFIGSCVDFDGSSYIIDTDWFIDFKNFHNISGVSDGNSSYLSWSYWIKVDTAEAFDRHIGLGETNDDRWQIHQDGTNGENVTLLFDISPYANYENTTSADIVDGNYHHILFEWKGDEGDLVFWVDGVNYVNNTVGVAHFYHLGNDESDFYLGANGVVPNAWIDARIDNLHVIMTRLQTEDIQQLYNNGEGVYLNGTDYFYNASFVPPANNAPVVTNIVWDPTTPVEGEDQDVSATYTDADGDSGDLVFRWSVNGTSVVNETIPTTNGSTETSTLSNSYYAEGDTIGIVVVADDGSDTSQDSDSKVVGAAPVVVPPVDEVEGGFNVIVTLLVLLVVVMIGVGFLQGLGVDIAQYKTLFLYLIGGVIVIIIINLIKYVI